MAVMDYGGAVLPYGTVVPIGARNYTIAPAPTASAPAAAEQQQFSVNKIEPWRHPDELIIRTDQGNFVYAPLQLVTKGYVEDGKQYYIPQFADQEFLKKAQPVKLDESVFSAATNPEAIKENLTKKFGDNAFEGFLFPATDYRDTIKQSIFNDAVYTYKITEDNPAITGLGTVTAEGQQPFETGLKYVQSSSPKQIKFIEPASGQGYIYTAGEAPGPGGGWLGKQLRSVAKTFAKIPLLTEATMLVPGVGPLLYAGVKGAQLGLSGKSPLEAGAQVGATIAAPTVVKNLLPPSLSSIPGVVPGVAGTATGLLTGQPIEQALKTGLASGVGGAVGGQVSSAASPIFGGTAAKVAGQIAGGTTAGLLGGKSAAESAIASTIGAGANLAGQAASNLVNRNLFSGLSETGAGKMDDFSNGGIQIFDDGSSIFFDNSGNVVGGIDNSGSQFNAPGFDLQIFDDGTFLARDSGGRFSFSTTDAPLFTGGVTVGSIGAGLFSNAPPTLSSTLGKVASQAASSGARSLLSKLLGGASSAINSALGANTSEQQIATLLQGLLNRGISYETAERVANDFRKEGQALQTAATQAGAQAAVPFTPYTVTSGFGTGTVGPTGATSTMAPEYAGIREQALGQAAQTLGAINPAQASQTLFGQLEGLAGPARQREQEQLLSRLGASGLLGIGRNLPTVGGGIAGVNPYIESLLSAQGTQQAQNALAATQFGTQEAQRQQALSQSLLGMGTGLDAIGLEQLSQAGNLGQLPLSAQQLNAQRQLEATLTGLRSSVPFSTTAANIQMGQTGLVGQTVQDLVSEIFRGR